MKVTLVTFATLMAAAMAAPAAHSGKNGLSQYNNGESDGSIFNPTDITGGMPGFPHFRNIRDKALAIQGQNGENIYIELDPEYEHILTRLRYGDYHKPCGRVIKSGGSIDGLLGGLLRPVTRLITCLGNDVDNLLIELDEAVENLLDGALPDPHHSIGHVYQPHTFQGVDLNSGLPSDSHSDSGSGLTIRGDITSNVNNDVSFMKFEDIPEKIRHEHNLQPLEAGRFDHLPRFTLQHDGCIKHPDGRLICDVGNELGNLLKVTGPNGEQLLVDVGRNVDDLLSGLGLGILGKPVGNLVAGVGGLLGGLLSSLGDLVSGLLCTVDDTLGDLLLNLTPTLDGVLGDLPLVGNLHLAGVLEGVTDAL
ncbi:hypothetical protein BDV59DRAFT_200549 [Aspergillus ambiguus]|uniref:uncharacterized protein n=1 Tax=Aspergillus ambiguus TaxID=176160 RepID=UPI003CCDB94D